MRPGVLILVTFFVLLLPGSGQAVDIELVTVDSPGNAPDPESGDQLGAVAYLYEISKDEITNAQYAEFLNSVAALGDSTGLWNPDMGGTPEGGIQRQGSGSALDPYGYQTISPMEDKPVNHVSWEDAARFVNWLQNGQLQGAACDSCTESGSYDLGSDGQRAEGPLWALPTEDEWYKAAFFSTDDGDGAPGYWLYPTRSDDEPTKTVCNEVGNGTTPLVNAANYDLGCQWNAAVGNVATVGTSGRSAFYGTFDQGGNVEELLENGTTRGGDFFNGSWRLASTGSPSELPAEEKGVGFRVVYLPEPSARALQILAVGWVALLARLRSSRRRRSG